MTLFSGIEASKIHKEQLKIGSQLSAAGTLILATAKANDELFVTQDSASEGACEKAIILGRKK